MTHTHEWTLSSALEALRRRELSAVELTRAALDRIAAHEPTIRAFITLTPERALADAERADQRRAAGEDAPLLGIPIALKDILSTQDVQTTAGSRILNGYVPVYSATVVERLQAAGMVMMGKANLDEFAMGSSTENSAYQLTRNPWNPNRVPGGSSGGSAAAVAAGFALGAVGTDTGGSIRTPAAFCGVVGLKPSYGRVSRSGLIAFGSSLDQAGPLARTVEDAARLLGVMAGHDPRDSTSMDVPVPDYLATMRDGVKGLRVGVPREYFVEGADPAMEALVRAAIAQLESLGAEIHAISLPHTRYSLPVYYIIAPAEASANLARFDGIRFGPRIDKGEMWATYKATRGQFGPEVKRRIMLGTYALSAGYYDAYYGKAQQVRTLIKADFEEAFTRVDVIAAPVTPSGAFAIGSKSSDPLAMYLEDVFTLPASLAGVPGISVPCGFDGDGMPIGLQMIAPAFREDVLIRAAWAYEQAAGWVTRTPPLDG
ncbi:MAG: Asp-tRNA(Asn)/Glu-tRNA(Gln) amidotransferase subunit GatA [bacterium]|nr:Asp-tRNA(Asn)/Glu-tRNA(Gln) amidotransferase subunit GatA [bacterium]